MNSYFSQRACFQDISLNRSSLVFPSSHVFFFSSYEVFSLINPICYLLPNTAVFFFPPLCLRLERTLQKYSVSYFPNLLSLEALNKTLLTLPDRQLVFCDYCVKYQASFYYFTTLAILALLHLAIHHHLSTMMFNKCLAA